MNFSSSCSKLTSWCLLFTMELKTSSVEALMLLLIREFSRSFAFGGPLGFFSSVPPAFSEGELTFCCWPP